SELGALCNGAEGDTNGRNGEGPLVVEAELRHLLEAEEVLPIKGISHQRRRRQARQEAGAVGTWQ
ncbi:hypothetical protein BHE74_00045689, partial [Ensete ventricosum]